MSAIPETVRTKALAAGASGWLDELPALVADLEHDWDLTVGPTYEDATEAFVAKAEHAGGTKAVLKVLVPRGDDAAEHEITALRLADGGGCARLLNADAERGALLLERLGPSLHDLHLPIHDRHEILVSVAAQMWRPVGAGNAFGCVMSSVGCWLRGV